MRDHIELPAKRDEAERLFYETADSIDLHASIAADPVFQRSE